MCVAPFTRSKLDLLGGIEGLSPLKVYEYLALERPVIASETFENGFLERINAGKCISPENEKLLANTIIELLKDDELRRVMGKNGRSYVVCNYSWKTAASSVEKICNEILKSS